MTSSVLNGIIDNRYQIKKRLGAGSFGEIYLCETTDGTKVAAKLEAQNSRCPQLRHEFKVYRELQGIDGFPRVLFYGQFNDFNVLVIELLGQSLEELLVQCGNKFSIRTVLKIANQMFGLIENMHSRHLIHRDIKPANFLFGINENSSKLFFIDFGLSKRFRDPETLQHVPYREGKSLTGTPRYASIRNHLGVEQSQRDDLESIAYVLIYFLKGVLPWQGLKAHDVQKRYQLICEKKQSVLISELCQDIPAEFTWFLEYSRELEFNESPNFEMIKQIFSTLYANLGYNESDPFDWEIKQKQTIPRRLSSNSKDPIVHKAQVIAPTAQFKQVIAKSEPKTLTQNGSQLQSKNTSPYQVKTHKSSTLVKESKTTVKQTPVTNPMNSLSTTITSSKTRPYLASSNLSSSMRSSSKNIENRRYESNYGIGSLLSNPQTHEVHSPLAQQLSNQNLKLEQKSSARIGSRLSLNQKEASQETKKITSSSANTSSSNILLRSSSVTQTKGSIYNRANSSVKPIHSMQITSQPPPLDRDYIVSSLARNRAVKTKEPIVSNSFQSTNTKNEQIPQTSSNYQTRSKSIVKTETRASFSRISSQKQEIKSKPIAIPNKSTARYATK